MDQFGLAMVGLAGALLGVAMQWALSQLTANSGRRVELLIDAYQRFIEATAALAAEARTGGIRDAQGWTNLIAAKQRIAYFAPPEVVSALATFARTSQVLGQPDADLAFAALLRAMRSSLKLPVVPDADLFQVLFGKDSA